MPGVRVRVRGHALRWGDAPAAGVGPHPLLSAKRQACALSEGQAGLAAGVLGGKPQTQLSAAPNPS